MNKLLLIILAFAARVSLAAPVSLNDIPGINLQGVQLEMTKQAWIALFPNAIPMVSNDDNILADRLADGRTLLVEFKDNKLARVTVAWKLPAAQQQSQQTQQWIDDYRVRSGNPAKIEFGKLRRGTAYRASGAVFDLGSQYVATKAVVESNDVSMQVTAFKTDILDAASTYVPFDKASQHVQRSGATPPPAPPAFRDFVAELVP